MPLFRGKTVLKIVFEALKCIKREKWEKWEKII